MKSKIFFTLPFLLISVCANSSIFAQTDTTQKKNDSTKTNQTQQTYTRPDAAARRKRYIKSMFSPLALARTVAGAGIGTWKNSPEEWGTKWEGFGRRVASGFGKNIIKQTTMYGLDEAFKLDSAFYRSQKRDFSSRLGNALISPFTARKENGKRTFGFPRIAATYTSSIAAYETWYPNRFNYKDGIKAGTISLGFNAAFNVFKEFWKK
jgi:hypothetical protein